jgi:acyl-CoA hydrolase
MLTPKPVSASAVNDHVMTVFPNDLNPHGTLFGGRVMEVGDQLCAIVAKRHAGQVCVTLGIDSVRFHASAKHGDIVIFKAAVNRVWRTSMEVGLKVITQDFRTREQKHIVSAFFTFVAVDDQLQPVEIASVIPESDAEKRRFEQAQTRREIRMQALR